MRCVRVKHALRGPWWYGEERREGPPPPGVLHGDTWDEGTGEVKRGNPGPIVGIVDLVSKVRFGFSSHGVPQYLFHPADPRFPPMIVGSKAQTIVNQWGVITTKDIVWSTTKSRWPSVSLQRLLGPVGKQDVEIEVLRLRYLRPVPRSKDGLGLVYPSLQLNTSPVDTNWDEVINIDPAGCRDVDDILAWRKTPDGYEVGIGIANVAALVFPGSYSDRMAMLKGQTLYRDGIVVEPMLPTSISEGQGSLLSDGEPRGVVMAIWQVEAGYAKGPIWKTTHIINRRTFTYESVLEDSHISNTLPYLLSLIARTDVGMTDPHRWIEAAMIAYNIAAADQLASVGVGILRRHQGMTVAGFQELADKTGCKELAFLGSSAGEYIAIEPRQHTQTQAQAHVGLGVERYCHATSPLRRYADLVNQRILVGILEAQNIQGYVEKDIVPWLNERAKEARAYEREAWCLSQLSATQICSEFGWVIGWSNTSDSNGQTRLRIYVPAWRRTVKVPLNIGNQEDRRIFVGRRGDPPNHWVSLGDSIKVSAFWDIRNTPEYRFTFIVDFESLPTT